MGHDELHLETGQGFQCHTKEFTLFSIRTKRNRRALSKTMTHKHRFKLSSRDERKMLLYQINQEAEFIS